ncbi:hypothetical protein [Rubrimonas cliftonensis]|uniref:Uncharacterized protein n=1 Tax=Rubrimonas cliftonensis TaxID=89524 RepID=A0A1H4BAC9_9RHOB|nr:hypothetical protein [Rubrimonas cliftonensis]SEA45103.1 hypothetical protein SAMN05444370_105103 [Rubrimonas cliftonensis]
MADTAHSTDFAVLRQRDRLEFIVLLWALAALFLVVAAFGRLLPRAWRPFKSTGKSIIGEAREAANTVAPFAFMR